MNSREKILAAIRKHQPAGNPLPDINIAVDTPNPVEAFTATLTRIGGTVLEAKDWNDIHAYLTKTYTTNVRIVTTIPALHQSIGVVDFAQDPHVLEDVHVAVLNGQLGVAENGAVWITEELMGDRALPFITEHLVLVIRKENVVPTMQQAYERIGLSSYEYGTFIAGPSKTADIEQSLVLGAHGPKSLAVFLLA